MNRHPDQTFREDVSHSEKEIPSSYLGDQRSALEIGNRALATLAQKGNRTVPKDDAGKRALSHELRKLAVWEERDSSRPGRRNRRVPLRANLA